jgi:hypothetical protein
MMTTGIRNLKQPEEIIMSDEIKSTPDELQLQPTVDGFDILDPDDLDAVSGGLAADKTCKTCYGSYTTAAAIAMEE